MGIPSGFIFNFEKSPYCFPSFEFKSGGCSLLCLRGVVMIVGLM